MVWFFTSVKSKMSLQVTLLIECFTTILEWTHIILDSIVLLNVNVQSLNATIGLIAALDGAFVGFHCSMRLKMIL